MVNYSRNSHKLTTIRKALLIFSVSVLLITIPACQPQKPKPIPTTPPTTVDQPAPTNRPSTNVIARDIPADITTADHAAAFVAELPALEDAWTAREIALHAALYHEAFRGRVADNTDAVLLQPARFDELPSIAIGDREFYVRVLARMNDLNMPVAWTTIEPPAPEVNEYFPGTTDLATRLAFEIIRRNDQTATVIAEVSDATAHTGSSRQRVTATFDGINWTVKREAARIIW